MQWYEDIMTVAQEAADYVGTALDAGMPLTDAPRQVLTDLGAAMEGAASYLAHEEGMLIEKCRRYALNAAHSVQKALAADTQEEARRLFTYEVHPLLLDLCYQLDLEYTVLRCPERHAPYLAQQIAAFEAARVRTRRTDFKYRVSIIVPAYNKVEFSRCAIESLFQYTDFARGDIELITINDGSTDETEAYFSSLPHEKKINLKYNVYNHLGWGIARHIAEGAYVVYFSNDAVATPHWLENLLAVHQAERDVFWVVPTCNEDCISNRQGIPVGYENTFEDMGRMEEFAAAHNVSNPLLWEERAVLMPFVSVVPNLFDVPEIRADYRYVMCDFEDDDFSAMLRRSGFRQILAKDTFVHHFGGVTLKEERAKQGNNNSIIAMRPVFCAKWGGDPWGSRGILPFLETLLDELPQSEVWRVLIIEPLFGEGLLSVRNYCRRRGRRVTIDAVVTDARCMADIRQMADTVRQVDSLDDLAVQMNGRYDCIILGAPLNDLPVTHIIPFLYSCRSRIQQGGRLYAILRNYHSFEHIMEQMPNDMSLYAYHAPVPLDGCRLIPVARFITALQETFSVPAVYTAYMMSAARFHGREQFERLVTEILGGEETRERLQRILAGDTVAFWIRS